MSLDLNQDEKQLVNESLKEIKNYILTTCSLSPFILAMANSVEGNGLNVKIEQIPALPITALIGVVAGLPYDRKVSKAVKSLSKISFRYVKTLVGKFIMVNRTKK